MAKDNKSLGMFRLDGLPPAMRGIPQVEVTFDIDANGIVNVSAKDKATNKEQKITITNTSNLSESEVDKMVKDAEANSEEDKKRKEEIEVKNSASSLVSAAERVLKDFEGKMSEDDKKKLEEQKDELKKAIDENADVERLKPLSETLQQTMFAISSAAYQQAAPEGAAEGQSEGPAPEGNNDDDVIDAEYTKQ